MDQAILQKANQFFNEQHFHCSQAVFAAFAESLGLDEKQALKIGGCFGAGMDNGEVCGCVTGALMALGLKYGQCEADDLDSRIKSRVLGLRFYESFRNTHGSCICRELLGYDFGNPDDLKILQTEKPYLAICPKLVASAVEIAADIMAQN